MILVYTWLTKAEIVFYDVSHKEYKVCSVHSGLDSEYSLLVVIMWFGRLVPTFWRNIMPSCSGRKWAKWKINWLYRRSGPWRRGVDNESWRWQWGNGALRRVTTPELQEGWLTKELLWGPWPEDSQLVLSYHGGGCIMFSWYSGFCLWDYTLL